LTLADFPAALSQWASGVTLVTIADGRDDIGVTVSAFLPVSMDPPLVAVALASESYPAEVLRDGFFAVTLLAAGQRVLAGRFSATGRPGARLMLEDVPHQRGQLSGALIPSEGLAALECSVRQVAEAGDHMLVTGGVERLVYASESSDPLLRYGGGYRSVA
jgi:flavin reductase (DIM6/NTAB) family NADH-FMN oxidoreductase RutF